MSMYIATLVATMIIAVAALAAVLAEGQWPRGW